MTAAMIPLLSLLVVTLIIGLLLLLMLVDRGRRGTALMALAGELNLDYRPYAAVSNYIRKAHFLILDVGQFRHFRHLLEGRTTDGTAINLFDYSLVTPGGTSTQTLLLMPCPLADKAKFCLCKQRWLQQDNFTESLQHPMQPLRAEQKPMLIRRWQIFSAQPETLWPRLTPELTDWLLAHPHLHIEWSDGILLLCRPGYLLEAEQIPDAVTHAQECIRLLQQAAPF